MYSVSPVEWALCVEKAGLSHGVVQTGVSIRPLGIDVHSGSPTRVPFSLGKPWSEACPGIWDRKVCPSKNV